MRQDDLKKPWSCSFLLGNRSVDEGDSVLKSGRGVRGGQVAEAVGKAVLLPEDMKTWQEKRSKHMLENLKRDSILVSFALQCFTMHVRCSIQTHTCILLYPILCFFFRPFKAYLRLETDFWRLNVASTGLRKRSNISRNLRAHPL